MQTSGSTAGPSLSPEARILLLGRQGAGKSLMGRLLAARFRAEFISMGDLLRTEQRSGSTLGVEIGTHIDRGEPVPPDMSYGLLQSRLDRRERDGALIFDGIPRLPDQVARVRNVLAREPTVVFHLDVPTVVAVERLQTRSTCVVCDWPHGPGWPPHGGRCTSCGGFLERRADDWSVAIGARHAVWGSRGAEVLRYYDGLGLAQTVRADLPVRDVEHRLVDILTSA